MAIKYQLSLFTVICIIVPVFLHGGPFINDIRSLEKKSCRLYKIYDTFIQIYELKQLDDKLSKFWANAIHILDVVSGLFSLC